MFCFCFVFSNSILRLVLGFKSLANSPNGCYVIWSIRTSIWESEKRTYIWELDADVRLDVWVLHIYQLIFSAIWCLTFDPYPTVNVTRYNSQSFNCRVDPNWSVVTYNYGSINIALFAVLDGKCKDFAGQTSGRYTTDCDDSTRTLYLTIKNVTDVYNGETIECRVTYDTGANPTIQSLINVQCT